VLLSHALLQPAPQKVGLLPHALLRLSALLLPYALLPPVLLAIKLKAGTFNNLFWL
jgi:hypothetical protein